MAMARSKSSLVSSSIAGRRPSMIDLSAGLRASLGSGTMCCSNRTYKPGRTDSEANESTVDRPGRYSWRWPERCSAYVPPNQHSKQKHFPGLHIDSLQRLRKCTRTPPRPSDGRPKVKLDPDIVPVLMPLSRNEVEFAHPLGDSGWTDGTQISNAAPTLSGQTLTFNNRVKNAM